MVSAPPHVVERLITNTRSALRGRSPYYRYDPETGCLLWINAGTDGYGKMQWRQDGEVTAVPAHRLMYEIFRGPVPIGLDMDHLCRNRACCNPWHVEPVTRKENVRRGIGHGSETHCPQGHPYDEANTWSGALGSRRCRECTLASNRRTYYRRKERKGGRPR